MSSISYGRSGVIDPALAGFAGAALAFAAFAMPEWRLTQIVTATGLPDFLAAAQPPLGLKARLGFALALGLFSFAAFFAILRRLDGAAAHDVDAVDADSAPEPIRLRRSDAHPDAPPRRPLVARDLGEPAFDAEPEEELLLQPMQAEAAAALPQFLVPQEEEEVADEPAAAGEDEQEVPFAFASPVPPEEAPAPPKMVAAEELPVPVAQTPVVPQPDPAPVAEGEDSIGRLMKRLEFGLARRERAVPVDPAAIAPRTEDAVGHRLRSAISELEKLAARG